MLIQKKLIQYLEVTEEICSLYQLIATEISCKHQSENQELELREQVLLGLATKIFSAFKCLVEDAKRSQSEAGHHLKTIVESFIYLHFVGKEEGNINAKLVLAKNYNEQIKFFKKNRYSSEQEEYLTSWQKMFEDIIEGIEAQWSVFKGYSIETIACKAELESIYNRIYKLACESAHLSDLICFMPLAKGSIRLDESTHSELWSIVAIGYGLFIMCDLLKSASIEYELSLDVHISALKDRVTTIRNLELTKGRV